MARNLPILKKRWILLITLFISSLFLLLFFLTQSPKETGEILEKSIELLQEQKQIAPISRIVTPKKGDILGRDFQVKVQEVDSEGNGLLADECLYSVYDCGTTPCTPTILHAKRFCNSSFFVHVGKEEECSSEGKEACRVIVHSKNQIQNSNILAENQGSIKTFGIDFTFPEVTLREPSFERTTLTTLFTGEVVDNVEVSNCQLLVDGKSIKAIVPLAFSPIPCVKQGESACYGISGTYTFPLPGVHDISLTCWDLAGNIGSSDTHTTGIVKNRAPKISSCRVSPTSGSISTTFFFQVEAVDADGDSLAHSWDLGDGTTLAGREVSYQYGVQGTFKPQVQVRDQYGAESECSTAWVVIE